MKIKKPKTITGYGVVGTYITPKEQLGGTLPEILAANEETALYNAEKNKRLLEFLEETDQWLCEITIKPVRKVNREAVIKFS